MSVGVHPRAYHEKAFAFGSQSSGQTGVGVSSSTARQNVPIQVQNETGSGPLTGITRIWAGTATGFALDGSGDLHGWGDNNFAQLGVDPDTTDCGPTFCRSRPAVVPGLSGVAIDELRANRHVLVIDSTTNTVWSWGANAEGELGTLARDRISGRGFASFTPLPITLLPQ